MRSAVKRISCHILLILSALQTAGGQAVLRHPLPATGKGNPFRTGTGSYHRTFTGGDSTRLLIVRRDSVLADIPAPGGDLLNVIVTFPSLPLSVLQKRPAKGGAISVQSAVSAVESEHAQFRSDLARLSSAMPVQGGMPAAQITFEYRTALNGAAISAARSVVEAVRKLPYVSGVSPDYTVSVSDSASNSVIGAEKFWGAYSTHGENIDIGIIDTGIDYLHEALGGSAFPNAKVVGGYNFVAGNSDPMDDNGHGTHVAAIVAGNGPPPVNLRGVAYNARLWAFKVLNAYGSGSTSTVIAGIDRALDPDDDPSTPTPIKVLNLSLGGSGDPTDPISQAIDNAVAAGVVCVVAAGNSGIYQSIGSPGCARRALTVGASTDNDMIAFFSSRGPTNLSFDVKPDLVAPGNDIESAKLGGGYISYSGTSMATPHVAGAAALLRQLHPSWGPDEVKAALVGSARNIGGDLWTEGRGRLDIMNAAAESVVVSPGILTFGLDDISRQTWSVTQRLTVFNGAGDADEVRFTSSQTLPPGTEVMFNPPDMTVPPGDSLSTEVTLVVDNTVCPFPKGAVPAYVDSIMLSSATFGSSATVPLAFLKSRAIALKFDQQPSIVFIHNGRTADSAFGSVLYNSRDTAVDLVPADTFDIVSTFYGDSAYVLRERIPVDGISRVAINRSEALNDITFQPLDQNGVPLPFNGLGTESLIHARSGIGLISIGGIYRSDHFFSNVSSAYSYSVSLVPEVEEGNFYHVACFLGSGISSSAILRNDPAAFRIGHYSFDLPPGTQSLTLAAGFQQSPQSFITLDFSGTIGTLSPPFLLTAWYSPEPAGIDRWYSHLWASPSPLEIFASPLYKSAYSTVTAPDTIKLFWSFSDLAPSMPAAATRQQRFGVPFGREMPVWAGQAWIDGATFNIDATEEAYFISPCGVHSGVGLAYTLFAGGVEQSSGTLGNILITDDYARFFLPSGRFVFTATDGGYRIGAVAGQAVAKITGTSGGYHSVPHIRNFQTLRDGLLPDTLPFNQITALPSQGSALTMFYRDIRDSLWHPLAAAVSDTVFRTPIPDSLATGYYALRAVAIDTSSDTLDYTATPAFFIPGIYLSGRRCLFDTVQIGCRKTLTVALHNLQISGVLQIQSISADLPDISVAAGGGALAPSESLACPVTFNPLSAGLKTGHVVITYQGGHAPDTILVSGVGKGTAGGTIVSVPPDTGWQILSLPVGVLCPYPLDGLFGYNGTYTPDNMMTAGRGYWKQVHSAITPFAGLVLAADTVPIRRGWNLIGAIGSPVSAQSVVILPSPTGGHAFFSSSDTGYSQADTLEPGKGYWLWSDSAGTMEVSATAQLQRPPSPGQLTAPGSIADRAEPVSRRNAGSLTVSAGNTQSRTLYFGEGENSASQTGADRLPPAPPSGGFDVRWGNDSRYASVPAGKKTSIPLRISSPISPVKLSWQTPPGAPVEAILEMHGRKILLSGEGSIDDAEDAGGPGDRSNRSYFLILHSLDAGTSPLSYALIGNYPNPFNPSTTIRYELPAESRVTILVTDILGREICTVRNGVEPAGSKEAVWDAAGSPSGVYFYSLKATSLKDPSKSYFSVKKMLLLR